MKREKKRSECRYGVHRGGFAERVDRKRSFSFKNNAGAFGWKGTGNPGCFSLGKGCHSPTWRGEFRSAPLCEHFFRLFFPEAASQIGFGLKTREWGGWIPF